MAIKLTQYSHGGGCGCKISPSILKNILRQTPMNKTFSDLIVGRETSDDAAVYNINGKQSVIATVDFFTPIVDDPVDFGRIAAANALSDIYAMGGKPIMALSLLGVPIDKIEVEDVAKILEGGSSVCDLIGIPIAGGHSVDLLEPVYGLMVTGLVDQKNIKRNCDGLAGDVIILTKPLGIGILSGGLLNGKVDEAGYREFMRLTTQVNTPGFDLAFKSTVNSMTDVTGFGLIGHLLEMCRGAQLQATLEYNKIPVISFAHDLAKMGVVVGATNRNRVSNEQFSIVSNQLEDWEINLLHDPQTSGGLLISVRPEGLSEVMKTLDESGFSQATVIGHFEKGPPRVKVL